MARITYGSIVTEIRGKMSGSCFSKCQSGFIMSNVPIPRVSTSQYNQAAKRAVVSLAATWRSLSAAQKLAWTNQAALTTFYNSLNQAYTPTGYQLFFAINDRIARAGKTLISNAVAWQVNTTNSPQPVSIVAATNTLTFGFTPSAVANCFYAWYVYEPQNKSFQGSNPPWRLLAVGDSFSLADTSLVPIMKQLFPTRFVAGMYMPFLQMQINYSTGLIQRLGLPSLVLIS